ncbi:MAG: alpha-beta hydrolase superfamily lysophospholipase [Cognaticolwellia sp.]
MIRLLFLFGCAEAECDLSGDGLGTPTAWELDAVAAGLPESPIADFLTAEDGLELAYRDWVPTDWTGDGVMMLFVPGSSAHSREYSAIGAGLADRGVYTRIIDVRGHGLSACRTAACTDPAFADRLVTDDGETWPGRLGDSADAWQISRDLGVQVADLRSAHPAATLVLGGHSSGGGVVSRWVEGGGSAHADAFALVAPYNHPDQPQVRPEVLLDCPDIGGTLYARLDFGALGEALRGNAHRYVLSFHKPPEYTDPLDVLDYTWNTVQGMATIDPIDFWSAYTKPVLVVAGSQDALLDSAITKEQAELAAQGQFIEMDDHSHVGLSWSDEVAAELADFAVDLAR